MLDQPVRIFAHFKEICLLLRRLHLPAAVWAFAIHKLGFRPEGLAGGTVKTLVGSLVNISLIVESLKNLLHLLFMVAVRCPDKFVIGNLQQIAELSDHARHIVHKLLGRNSGLLRFQLDLLSMLVGSRLEEHVISLCSFVPCDAVRQHDLIVVADMRLARCIGDRSRNVILFFAHFVPLFLFRNNPMIQKRPVFLRTAQEDEPIARGTTSLHPPCKGEPLRCPATPPAVTGGPVNALPSGSAHCSEAMFPVSPFPSSQPDP